MPCNLCGKWNCVCQYSQSKQQQEFTSGFFSREAMKEHSDFHPQPKAEQDEPVFHLKQYGDVTKEQLDCYIATGRIDTHPQPRTWVGLTDEDLKPICDEWRIVYGAWMDDFAKDIEAKLKEKNT